jgi:hypothetical protein
MADDSSEADNPLPARGEEWLQIYQNQTKENRFAVNEMSLRIEMKRKADGR